MKTISTNQMTFTVATIIASSSLITTTLYQYIQQDSWMVIIASYVVALIIIAGIYIPLSKRFKKQELVGINKRVFGKYIGPVISAAYLFYFLTLGFLNLHDMLMFANSAMLRETPQIIVGIAFMILVVYAAKKGSPFIVQYSFFIFFVSASIILLNTGLLIPEFSITNYLPMLTFPLKNYLISMNHIVSLPLLEIFVCFSLIPNMYKPQEFGKALLRGCLIGSSLLLLFTLREVAVLGGYIIYSDRPSYASVRMIDVGDILTRMEILYGIILTILLFFKISIIFSAVIISLKNLLQIKSPKYFINIFGVLIILYGTFGLTGHEHITWQISAAPQYATFFVVVLPIITLVVAVIRKAKDQEYLGPPYLKKDS